MIKYFKPEIECAPRHELEALQSFRLSQQIRRVYENVAPYRAKMDAAGVKPEDAEAECKRYYEKIKEAGGIDVQLLGIGTNGHIGFNEPGDEFKDTPFLVKLTQSTIDSNKKYFEAVGTEMPGYALTMGVGDIMRAKKIVLIATGEAKAKAVKALVEGEVTPSCPASILQLHSDVTVFLDKESASLLEER